MNPKSAFLLSQVHPELADRVQQAGQKLAADWGIEIRVIEGLRTYERQDELYAQGRTAPGPHVTNARGGYSSHNFGLAVDVVPGIQQPGAWQPDWTVAHPAFRHMIDELKGYGLAWGGDWVHMPGDFDHFYLRNSPADPTDLMRSDFAKGLPVVFAQYTAGAYK